MRKINKQTPIAGFNGNKYGNSCSNWDDFHKNHKEVYEETRLKILTDEQEYLDGYTELYINELEDSHIDHYKKKSIFPQLTFDWNNLIVATKDSDFGANYKDSKYQIKQNEYSLIFNPVVDNVEEYFYYSQLGEVEPKCGISQENKAKVNKTIEVFNLNHSSLVKRRKNLMKLLESYKNSNLNKNDILSALETTGFKRLVIQEI